MLSPTSDSAAKWNTACQGPSASTASTRGGIGEIGLDQPHAGGDRGAMALAQIVEHRHVVAAFGQGEDEMAADIAGAAGDEEPLGHGRRLARRGAASPAWGLARGVPGAYVMTNWLETG